MSFLRLVRYFSPDNLPLWLLGLLSLVGYLTLSFWFPLYPYFNHVPMQDIHSLAPSLGQGLAYGALLCLLFGLYSGAYRRIQRQALRYPLGTLLLGAALFSLPLLFTYPYSATDVYRYFLGGRISAVYGQSPLQAPPANFPDDPYMVLAGEWGGEASPYGPTWETAAALLGYLSADNLWIGLLLFKGLAALLHLVISGLIWLLLDGLDPATRAARTMLWAWNPALLLIFVVNGHNDGLMLLWLILGLWVQRRGRPALGLIIMALSPLTKASGLLALPFFYVAAWRQLADYRAKIQTVLTAGMGSLVLAVLFFLPFGSPLDLALRLQQEAASGGGFSLAALIILAGRRLGFDPSVNSVTSTATLLFMLTAIWLLWRTWHGRSPLTNTAVIFAAYLVQAFRFRIWYTSWILPWLLLEEGEGGRGARGEDADTPRPILSKVSFPLAAAVSLLLTSQLSVIIYGHIRIHLFNGDHLIAHLVGVPFTLFLPLLLALFASGYSPRSDKRQRKR